MSFENITLNDCEIEDGIGQHGVGTRYTHESGAYVELIHDDSPHHPLDDVEGIAVAFREGDRYSGTADEYPRDPVIDCSRCEGSGEDPERFELHMHMPGSYALTVIGAGTEAAMLALEELYDPRNVVVEGICCSSCGGAGEIDVDIETYFRVEREARAIYQFDTGNYGEATAVMYVTDDDWTDPVSTVKAWADEYKSWADGDVWGIECGGPGVESESVWGFIGDYAKEAALSEFLIPTIENVVRLRRDAIEAARVEQIERDECAARDIITEEV